MGKLSLLELVAFEKWKDLNQIEEFPVNKYSKINNRTKNSKQILEIFITKGFLIRMKIIFIDTFTQKESAMRHEKTSQLS